MQLIIMGMRYEVTTIDKAKITFSLEMVRIATRGQPKKINENFHIMWMWTGVYEFRPFRKIRFQSMRSKVGPHSIEELTILGSIYCDQCFI